MNGCPIDIAGLEVRLGGQTVLGPLELELAGGEYLCILGHSGSGKSTLLRAIAGLELPASGSISLDGREVSRAKKSLVPPEKRGIGMLFQQGALWPHMSVERTLRFALSCAGVPRSMRTPRIAALLARVHLEGFERRKPASLSGGEKQRLALARALAPEPRILLLDEPLGPLDAALRDELCDSLRELHAELGFTALHVTHDPAEPGRIGARTLHLRDGRWAEGES